MGVKVTRQRLSLRTWKSEGGRVLAFVRAIGMTMTWCGREAGQGARFRPAEFTGILGFLVTLVERVLSLVRTIGMPMAWRGRE